MIIINIAGKNLYNSYNYQVETILLYKFNIIN